MDKELFNKLQNGDNLDARESLLLEQELESGNIAQVAQWLEALSDSEPSLAWRSNLNDQLRAIAPKPKKKFNWMAPAATVTGLATCALAVVLLIPKPTSNPSTTTDTTMVAESADLSTTLVRAHLSDQAEVSGGIRSPRRTIEPGYDWDSL